MESGRGIAWRGRRAWHRARLAGLGAGLALCLGLAACGSGRTGTGAASPPAAGTATSIVSTGTVTTGSTQTSPTATPFEFGTPGAVLGTTDACATQGTPSATPPSSIPIYASAQMTIGSVNGKSGVFGLCSSDSVSTIDAYYAAQLPADGWQHVTNDPLDNARQLTAQQGSTSLIVTILPDTGQNAKTNILIIYSGT
jgi:hypothetical protein